jgi:hemoglobin-like flavoprotein
VVHCYASAHRLGAFSPQTNDFADENGVACDLRNAGMNLSAGQVELLQQSWRSVLPVGDVAAELFYGKLFGLEPGIRRLFKNDMKEQGRNLTAMISVAVGSLSRPESIERAVRSLGRRHAAYGVEERHYELVAVAMLWMLEKCLGEAFTPEVKDAWAKAYALLSGLMKGACVPLYGLKG